MVIDASGSISSENSVRKWSSRSGKRKTRRRKIKARVATSLTAPRIASAIASLSRSRAKASAFFDFLIVKRTFVIKGQSAVAITETEPAFIQALDEFGACGEYNGQQV